LPVRPVTAVFAADTFVWAYAAPGQCLYDILLRTRNKSSLVRIFDTKQEVTAVLFGE
jgi:hypothetical protein